MGQSAEEERKHFVEYPVIPVAMWPDGDRVNTVRERAFVAVVCPRSVSAKVI